MFENYTDKAAHVLKQAKKVSAECGQSYVGTEHILIALLREDSCAAAELLAERKVEESTVQELIRELISPEGGVTLGERSGFTPRAKRCFIMRSRRQPGSTRRRPEPSTS